MNDRYSLSTTIEDCFPGLIGQGDLMLKEVRWGEGVVADNCRGG
jgi:hypothetical protein